MGVTLLHVIKSTQSSECPHWSHRKELCFGVAIPHASVRAHRAGLWPVVEAADVFGFLLLLRLAVAHSPLANPSVLVVKVAWTLCNKVNLLAWIWCGAQAFSYYDVFLSLPVLTGRAVFHVDALSFSQPGCRGASFDQRTWSVPCLCTHRDTDEFLESCTVGSSKSPAIFVPVLSSSPQLVLSIYAFRKGHVFLLNLKQEAMRFSKHKVNAAVSYLREQRSLSRASVCCREAVREVFGG